jgi:hypothetical protein
MTAVMETTAIVIAYTMAVTHAVVDREVRVAIRHLLGASPAWRGQLVMPIHRLRAVSGDPR